MNISGEYSLVFLTLVLFMKPRIYIQRISYTLECRPGQNEKVSGGRKVSVRPITYAYFLSHSHFDWWLTADHWAQEHILFWTGQKSEYLGEICDNKSCFFLPTTSHLLHLSVNMQWPHLGLSGTLRRLFCENIFSGF